MRQLMQRRLDHHLARELHAWALELEVEHRLAREAAQAAMEVADRDLEEQPADEGEHRIAEIAVQGGHGALCDAALEPVAHDQVRAVAQLCDHGVQVLEIVAVVGVAHDDVLAAGGRDAADQGRAVAALGHGDQARAVRLGDGLGAVGGAVVGDQHLARDAGALEEAAGLVDADRQRFRLVQAGHQNGELERRLVDALCRTRIARLDLDHYSRHLVRRLLGKSVALVRGAGRRGISRFRARYSRPNAKA